MKFDMARLPDEDVDELVALLVVFWRVAPSVYGPLQDCALAEQLRRQRARRHGHELIDQPPAEIVLQVRGEDELRSAVRHLAAHHLAAVKEGFPRLAEFLKEAVNDLIDMGIATVEARGESIN